MKSIPLKLIAIPILAMILSSCGNQGTPPAQEFQSEVIIYGGTSAAVIAAVQLANMEREVILVSPDTHMGGMTASGLGWTDTGNKAVIGGLARNFYHRLFLHYQQDSAWRWQRKEDYGNAGQGNVAIDGEFRTMWIFEPHAAETVFDQMLEEHRIRVYRDEWLDREAGVVSENGTIRSIRTLSGKLFRGDVFIDATYEGDLMAAAGIAYHVADAQVKKAVVIEASAKAVAVRYAAPDMECLWQSNHSNCYPGWMGYTGTNMVTDQAPIYDLKNINSIENWQASLRERENISVPAPSRFERYHELLREHQGNITVDTATRILSDRHDPYTGRSREKSSPSESNNLLATICALYPEDVYATPSGEFSAHITNLWSLVTYPATGDFWLAMEGTPAQEGGYRPFNLQQELEKKP